MTEGPFACVWDAIIDDPAEAANLRIRSELMMRLTRHIKDRRWSQAEAANRLGVTQPRISDLMRGKINLFSVDALIGLATVGGLKVEVQVSEAA